MFVSIHAMIVLLLGWSYPITEALHVGPLYQRNEEADNLSGIELPRNGHLGSRPLTPNDLISTMTMAKLRNQPRDSHRIQQLLDFLTLQSSFSNQDMKYWNEGRELYRSISTNVGKRNEPPSLEHHVGGCVATVHIITLNSNYYPRLLRSYNCTSQACNSTGTGQCKPKEYTVQVLRQNLNTSELIDQGCDTNLPEDWRCNWKLVSVNVTTYCECRTAGLS